MHITLFDIHYIV